MPVLVTADVLAPSVALGEGITRIGCFLNGCCYGLPCDAGFCVRFPADGAAAIAYHGAAVHPTQLYASAIGFLSFFVLSALLRRSPFPGATFGAFLVIQGIQRLLLDLVRHQDESVIWFRIGTTPFGANQGVSAAILAVGVILLISFRARASARA